MHVRQIKSSQSLYFTSRFTRDYAASPQAMKVHPETPPPVLQVEGAPTDEPPTGAEEEKKSTDRQVTMDGDEKASASSGSHTHLLDHTHYELSDTVGSV